jgi:hypothetical protein
MHLFQHFSMGKNKSIGTEYQIAAQGTWEQVAESVRTTKEAIKSTQPIASFFSSGEIEVENRILRAYLVPKEGEIFGDYKERLIQTFSGNGVRGKLASLLSGKKITFNFHLTQNNGESTLRIDSVTQEGGYQAKIRASGDYTERGASIATGVKESLERGSVQHTYKTLDKLI